MKALIDTCVILDFLQQRKPFEADAARIMRLAATEQFAGYITAKSATDIYYMYHKFTHSDEASRSKLGQLLALVGLLDTSANDIYCALASDVSDFEDAVMAETAHRYGIDCIVTRNLKDYKNSKIKIYAPTEFIAILM